MQDAPADIVDAVFAIACRCLPVDHAYALQQAIQDALPWFAQEPRAGLHTVHGAASGSGWMRPEGADALLQLSHRARLALRLPRHRLEDAAALLGRTLQVAGWPLHVEKMALRPLSRITTLFSRCVVLDALDEAAFVSTATDELGAIGIRAERMVCGRVTPVATPERTYQARSLMLAGLTLEQSLLLQQSGLGAGRKFGCGLFIPHKDIADLRSRPD
jgi:CRISPR-associated protein Cas6